MWARQVWGSGTVQGVSFLTASEEARDRHLKRPPPRPPTSSCTRHRFPERLPSVSSAGYSGHGELRQLPHVRRLLSERAQTGRTTSAVSRFSNDGFRIGWKANKAVSRCSERCLGGLGHLYM